MATNPGLTLSLSQNGLNYAADVAVDQLVSDIQGQSIPDQHGEDRNDLGKVYYDITRTSVTGFTKPSSSVVVTPGSGITWTLSGAAVAIHGDWHYKYKKSFVKIRDSGSFDASVSRVSLSAGITLGMDTNGRPTISMTSCTSDVGDVSVKFHGGASFLYNLFRKVLERPIADKIKNAICKSARKAVDEDAAKSLQNMRVRVPIEGLITLDYRLVAAPVFGERFLESRHKGEFLWTENPSDPPFPPNPMDVPRDTQKMVTFCLSDYVMNSLGYALHSQGLLKYTLTRSDLPEKYCDYLNTSCNTGACVGSFLPQLRKDYPDGSVELHMETTSPPNMTTSAEAITATFAGTIVFNVRIPDGSLKHAFTSDLEAVMPLSVKMEGHHLTAMAKSFKFNVLHTKSEIGNIDGVLQFLLNVVGQHFILRKLNEKGEKGLDLPGIDHVQFTEPELTMIEGAICFRTDARYDPTLRYKSHM